MADFLPTDSPLGFQKPAWERNSWLPRGTFGPTNPVGGGALSGGNPGTNPGAGQPGSAIENYYGRLMELMPTRQQQGLSDVGSILGAFSSGQKADRVVQGNFQGDYDRMMMDREAQQNQLGLQSQSDYDRLKMASAAEQRDSEGDALKKLQMGQYLAGGGSDYKPQTAAPSLMFGGREVGGQALPQFSGLGPRAATAMEQQAGGDLSSKMMGRLQAPAFEPTKFNPQYNYQPTNPAQAYGKPGIMEKIGSYGSLATGALGALDMLKGGGMGGPGSMGAMNAIGGGLAKAGGALGSAGSAIGSGLAGAGKGIMGLLGASGPALPIAAGGLGAFLLGKKLLSNGPSKEEVAGRSAAAQGRQSLTAGATPEQRAQAQGAGWENPDAALLRVVLRDKLGDDQQAASIVDQLFKAEKMGPGAVQQILSQLG